MGLSSLVFQFISISNKLSYVGLWGISSRAEVPLFSHCKHLIEQRGIEREGSLEQTMGEDLARENERLKQKSIVSSMVRMMPPHPAAPPPCAPRLAEPSFFLLHLPGCLPYTFAEIFAIVEFQVIVLIGEDGLGD